MSNSLAIATVTSALRNLLFQGVSPDLPGVDISARPPDRARGNANGNQLNLFLYATEINTGWRNQELPSQARPGEAAEPPLPLNLHYLISAWGANDEDVLAHRALGRAMSVLHDHSVLSPEELSAALPGSDLHEQIERIRITYQPLAVDEMSKLWTTFQTQYRISAGYLVTVVLIESRRPARSPVPVLQRTPSALAGTTPFLPVLDAVGYPPLQLGARPGDDLVLTGRQLSGTNLLARFTHARLDTAFDVPPPPLLAASDSEVRLRVPDAPAPPAGVYTVALSLTTADGSTQTTNALPLGIAPRITTPLPLAVNAAPNGSATVDLSVTPAVRPGQRVLLLLGELQVPAQPLAAETNDLSFTIPDAAAVAGSYLARVRVDGVDSPLPLDPVAVPPEYDANQRVTINA